MQKCTACHVIFEAEPASAAAVAFIAKLIAGSIYMTTQCVCVCVCVCVCACVRGNCRTLQRSESSIGCSSRMQHHTANVMPARLLGVFMFLLASAAPVLCRHA